MTTPHPRHLTFTVTWGHEKSASLSVDSLIFKLLVVAALCAGSYDVGRRQGTVTREVVPMKPSVLASAVALPREDRETFIVPGPTHDQAQDIITPLNVRDPTALVMGPGVYDQIPPAAEPPPVPSSRVRENDWRDEIRREAREWAKEGDKKAPKAAPDRKWKDVPERNPKPEPDDSTD